MSNIDKNKVFFGLLHYIFTEQPNVNWAFKTSLVNFTGINETLNQRRYKNDSISNDIIKYIKYVKPYHVQFDHYIEKYKVPLEICNTKVNDSIFPTIKVRYDNVAPKPDIYDYLYSSEKYKINTTIIDDDYEYGKFKDFKISVVNQNETDTDRSFFFPKDWGKLVSVKQTVSNNETHDYYVYILSLRFENDYVLPVVIRRNDDGYCNIEWKFNFIERTEVKTYNSATYNKNTGSWTNNIASDPRNMMLWSRNSVEMANKDYDEAKIEKWDEGHLINGKPSTSTNRFNITFNNGLLNIRDTYRNNMLLGSYTYYDTNPTKFFPEQWGKLVSVKQTVSNNETHDSYVYTLSLNFENGYVLPVIIKRNNDGYCNITWNFDLVEQTNEEYNSATYSGSVWRNSNASDMPSQMMWVRESSEVANKDYSEAKRENWDEGHEIGTQVGDDIAYHPSVFTSRFGIYLNNYHLSIYDNYRNYLLFEAYTYYDILISKPKWFYGCDIIFDKGYQLPMVIDHNDGIVSYTQNETFFPEHWGKLVEFNQTVANNETHKGYVYTWSLRFENGYVLPVVIKPDFTSTLGDNDDTFRHSYSNTIIWNFDWVEQTNVTTYNGATYSHGNGQWINTTAQDQPSHMIWARSGIERANKSYNEAKREHWDEDHLINRRPSCKTNRFKEEIGEYYLIVKDTYNNDNVIGFWTFTNTDSTFNNSENSFFPTEWGFLNKISQSVVRYYTDYGYGLSLSFTNGYVLPIYINKNTLVPTVNFNWVEQTDITEYNSACLNTDDSSWLNVKATDKPNQMIWSRYNKEKANQDYIVARSINWDENHEIYGHPSVHTYRFKFEITDDSLVIKDTYNNNNRQIAKWKLQSYARRAIWDDSQVYSKNPNNPINYNLNWIENTTEDYNSSIYIDNKLILSFADDINNEFIWKRNNSIINSCSIEEASSYDHPKWDYGNALSTATDTYYGIISDDKLTLSIYNYDGTLFKEYNLETFSKKIVDGHTEIDTQEPLNKTILTEGTKYYNEDDLVIYRLTTDRKGNLIWVYDSVPVENELYYFKKTDSVKIYKTVYNTELKKDVTDFYDLENEDYFRLNETTMANRLFLYKTHDLELIKEYTNSHFKGITIDGGDLSIDRQGYDAFLYDLKRYEEPTKTNAYCLINTNYTQILTGSSGFTINNITTQLRKDEIKILSYINGIETEIRDYSIDDGNRVTLFKEIIKDEEIIVKRKSNNSIIQRYISNYFDESNEENYSRKFLNVNNIYNDEYELEIPFSTIKVDKVVVSIEKPNGYRYPITNFRIVDNKIYVSTNSFIETINNRSSIVSNRINWKIYVSIADYSLIYDKIYTWEDVYGVANNNTLWEQYYKNHGLIQNINGNDFLNPHYEKDRPDELCVSQPQDSMMMYFYRANSKKSKKIFNYNFKNDQKMIPTLKSSILTKDFNIGDNEIWIEKDVFDKPYKDPEDDKKLKPGKIIINSEIIEFYDYELHDDKSIILRKIRRGIDGSFIKKSHLTNSIVYPFGAYNEHPYYLTPSYYYIKDKNMVEFDINGNKSIHDSRIEVYKTNRISLLTEINEYQDSFIISDNSIVLPKYDKNNNIIKKGYLFINGIKITFNNIEETIYKNNTCYKISNYDLPIGVSFNPIDELIIPSNKYFKLNEEDYTINTIQHKKLEKAKNQRFRNYITFNTPVKVGENIIIENYNFNVFN